MKISHIFCLVCYTKSPNQLKIYFPTIDFYFIVFNFLVLVFSIRKQYLTISVLALKISFKVFPKDHISLCHK